MQDELCRLQTNLVQRPLRDCQLRLRNRSGWRGLLPVAKRTAEQRRGATFATENDDVAAARHVEIPRHKADAVRSYLREDPVIAGFFLGSADARKCRYNCHCLIPLLLRRE